MPSNAEEVFIDASGPVTVNLARCTTGIRVLTTADPDPQPANPVPTAHHPPSEHPPTAIDTPAPTHDASPVRRLTVVVRNPGNHPVSINIAPYPRSNAYLAEVTPVDPPHPRPSGNPCVGSDAASLAPCAAPANPTADQPAAHQGNLQARETASAVAAATVVTALYSSAQGLRVNGTKEVPVVVQPSRTSQNPAPECCAGAFVPPTTPSNPSAHQPAGQQANRQVLAEGAPAGASTDVAAAPSAAVTLSSPDHAQSFMVSLPQRGPDLQEDPEPEGDTPNTAQMKQAERIIKSKIRTLTEVIDRYADVYHSLDALASRMETMAFTSPREHQGNPYAGLPVDGSSPSGGHVEVNPPPVPDRSTAPPSSPTGSERLGASPDNGEQDGSEESSSEEDSSDEDNSEDSSSPNESSNDDILPSEDYGDCNGHESGQPAPRGDDSSFDAEL